LKNDYSIGVLIFRIFPRSIKYLVIKHNKGHWAFPKGHPDKKEKKIETALRELKEETGIKKINLLKKKVLIKEEYMFVDKKGVKNLKKVDYFIAGTNTKNIKIDYKEILSYRWCTFKTAIDLITFKESKDSLKTANKIVKAYLKQ